MMIGVRIILREIGRERMMTKTARVRMRILRYRSDEAGNDCGAKNALTFPAE
jgi:hypothetical protein